MTDRSFKTLLLAAMAFGLLGVSTASAQDSPQDDPLVEAEGQDEAQPLPPPRSDDDPRPPAPIPPIPGGVIEQAGVGGSVAYGRAGVLELGGSAGFTAATGFTAASINPSVGWFFADNLQLSGILGVAHVSTDVDDATIFSLLLEPSYHLPFNDMVFGFLGLGVGGSHVDDVGTGFAVAPRIGANVMVGRSGILTPSLSYQYTTHDTIETDEGTALLSVSTALSANVGYTVMW